MSAQVEANPDYMACAFRRSVDDKCQHYRHDVVIPVRTIKDANPPSPPWWTRRQAGPFDGFELGSCHWISTSMKSACEKSCPGDHGNKCLIEWKGHNGLPGLLSAPFFFWRGGGFTLSPATNTSPPPIHKKRGLIPESKDTCKRTRVSRKSPRRDNTQAVKMRMSRWMSACMWGRAAGACGRSCGSSHRPALPHASQPSACVIAASCTRVPRRLCVIHASLAPLSPERTQAPTLSLAGLWGSQSPYSFQPLPAKHSEGPGEFGRYAAWALSGPLTLETEKAGPLLSSTRRVSQTSGWLEERPGWGRRAAACRCSAAVATLHVGYGPGSLRVAAESADQSVGSICLSASGIDVSGPISTCRNHLFLGGAGESDKFPETHLRESFGWTPFDECRGMGIRHGWSSHSRQSACVGSKGFPRGSLAGGLSSGPWPPCLPLPAFERSGCILISVRLHGKSQNVCHGREEVALKSRNLHSAPGRVFSRWRPGLAPLASAAQLPLCQLPWFGLLSA